MKPITFNIFKYKLIVDDERIRFMYGKKQISKTYFADILAKTVIRNIDKESLFRNILHIPTCIGIDAVLSEYNMFITSMDELRGLLKSRHLSSKIIDKIMAVSKIGRNYMVDYSGLHNFRDELLTTSWDVKALKANDKCDGQCIEKLNILIDGNKARVDIMLHVYSIIFYVHIDTDNVKHLQTDKKYMRNIAVAIAIYYILKTTKHSINKRIKTINTEERLNLFSIHEYKSEITLSEFVKNFADEIPTNTTLEGWTYDKDNMLSKKWRVANPKKKDN